jgi:murein DD-endopeptidase MepM/ murein hydrolase activator NlpD
MTAAMHKRLFLLGALAAAIILTPGTGAAQAQTPIRHSLYQQYVDPFTASGWYPARTDMGVDWLVTRPLPVLAIGDAVILGSNSHDSGWPGGHFIWYQLLDGSHAGDVIYVAEHLKSLIAAGAHVRAGQKIAEALPGGTGTEWGWGEADGATRANGCYHEGVVTHSGREMARFMKSLGAQVQDPPGPGIDAPFGKLC